MGKGPCDPGMVACDDPGPLSLQTRRPETSSLAASSPGPSDWPLGSLPAAGLTSLICEIRWDLKIGRIRPHLWDCLSPPLACDLKKQSLLVIEGLCVCHTAGTGRLWALTQGFVGALVVWPQAQPLGS